MTTIYTLNEKINEWTTDVLHAFDHTAELEQLKAIDSALYQAWSEKKDAQPKAFETLSLEEEIADFLEEREDSTSRESLLHALFEQIRKVCSYINPLDWEMDYKTYIIALSNDNACYKVFAPCEQDALDILVDYCEEKEWNGYFLEEEDIEDEEHVIRAGNHSLALSPDYLLIKEA